MIHVFSLLRKNIPNEKGSHIRDNFLFLLT